MPILFVTFAIALILSYLATPVVRDYVRRKGLLDHPSQERQIHTEPTPRVGGIAVFAAFLTASCLIQFVGPFVGFSTGIGNSRFFMFLGHCSGVFLIGLADDFLGLSAKTKLALQTAAACSFYFFVSSISIIGNPFTGQVVTLGWWGLPLTVIWLVGITNAYNLIDGADGLATGSAFFTALAMMYVAQLTENTFSLMLTVALAGASLGFLRYNFFPASIFLGDCGALFLGFTIAALGISGSQKSTTLVTIAVQLLACGFPILETSVSIFRRLLTGKHIFGADRRHIHHQLLARGFTQRQVAFTVYGVSAGLALLGLLVQGDPERFVWLALVALGGLFLVGVRYLGYGEFAEVLRLLQRLRRQPRMISNNLHFRHVLLHHGRPDGVDDFFKRLDKLFRHADFVFVELRIPAFSKIGLVPGFHVIEQKETMVVQWPYQASVDHFPLSPKMNVPLQNGKIWGQCHIVLPPSYLSGAAPYDLMLMLEALQIFLHDGVIGFSNRIVSLKPEPLEQLVSSIEN